MLVEPAHIDQIKLARTGRMVAISSDVGGVAADLARIDPGLCVRFAEASSAWIVFYKCCPAHKKHQTDCQSCRDGQTTQLVSTAKAYQTASGIWTGLDARLVEHMHRIDPEKGYDYAAEVDKQNVKACEDRRHAFREKIGGTAEQAAHALRKDLGVKTRAFFHKGVA